MPIIQETGDHKKPAWEQDGQPEWEKTKRWRTTVVNQLSAVVLIQTIQLLSFVAYWIWG